MNEYYVYYHRRLKDNSIFYIGKGKDDRVYSKIGRNIHWKRIVKKDGGFNIEIIKENLTNNKACELEIKEINRVEIKNLSNQAEGGQGGNTRVGMSNEEYEKWKYNHVLASKGKPKPWLKGKKRPEHSKFMTGRKNPKLKEISSKPKTDATKKKMSIAKTGVRFKKIECEKCHRLIPLNNMNRHLKGNECITKKSKEKLATCEFCKRLVSIKKIKPHQRGIKCKEARVDLFI